MTRTGKRVMVTTAAATAALVAVGCTSANASSTRASGAPTAAGTTTPTEDEVRALFDGWNDTLATLDAEKVADRYASEAVLLPTVSNQVRTDRAGIVDYFEHFLENRPQGTILESRVKVLDSDAVIDTGTYRFSLNGGQRTVEARYTFVYELVDGEWKIVNHHSSAMPES